MKFFKKILSLRIVRALIPPLKISDHVIIIAGVSSSGKSFFINELRKKKYWRELNLVTRPQFLAKHQIESRGVSNRKINKPSVVHVEINPSPNRIFRTKWLQYVKYSTSVIVVLIIPNQKTLALHVKKRSLEIKSEEYASDKLKIYTNEFLFKQYSDFCRSIIQVSTLPREKKKGGGKKVLFLTYQPELGAMKRFNNLDLTLEKIKDIYF